MKLAEEKGGIREDIWDLDPGVMEKVEHALSCQRAQQAVNC
ncbi:hypothetical protein T458_26495 [Brevibacillus panacihumi W25]|uniref:Uncharacterized protein n=1 Tax=Brevibacillus panacihumi W25 TaxID=1408254 RepID=V6M0K0_9BACL|nr:hypothetical protein T458_26495 [Brevibacillus panacihumi W25]